MTTSESLKNLREAHRLIYAFQRCSLDFVFRVKNEIFGKGDTVDGLKHFSRDLPKRKSSKSHNVVAFSAVNRLNWAWDFLPTYAYEYYLGEANPYSRTFVKASIIQIVDDAVYGSARGIVQNDGKLTGETASEMLDISHYTPCDEAHSWYVFICQSAVGHTPDNGEYLTNIDTSDETISQFIRSKKKIEVKATSNGFDVKYLVDMKDIFTHHDMDKTIILLNALVREMCESLKFDQETALLIEEKFSE